MRVSEIFKSAKECSVFLSILNLIATELKLNQLDSEELDRTLEYNLTTFDQVAQRYFKPKTVLVRGKYQVVGYKRPNQPRVSPVLLKEENQLIEKLLSFKWRSLEHFKVNWTSLVYNLGFDAVCAKIGVIYNTRWRALERYASFTTKRLNGLRKANPDKARFKKSQFTREDIVKYLKTLEKPIDKLMDDLKTLIASSDWKTAIEKASGKQLPTRELITKAFAVMVLPVYKELLDLKYKDEDLADIGDDAISPQKIANVLGQISKLTRINQQATEMSYKSGMFFQNADRLPGIAQASARFAQGVNNCLDALARLSDNEARIIFNDHDLIAEDIDKVVDLSRLTMVALRREIKEALQILGEKKLLTDSLRESITPYFDQLKKICKDLYEKETPGFERPWGRQDLF
jgi:hypothetical protein